MGLESIPGARVATGKFVRAAELGDGPSVGASGAGSLQWRVGLSCPVVVWKLLAQRT